jgi:hypothetical protein
MSVYKWTFCVFRTGHLPRIEKEIDYGFRWLYVDHGPSGLDSQELILVPCWFLLFGFGGSSFLLSDRGFGVSLTAVGVCVVDWI